jgi:hypothetical protein
LLKKEEEEEPKPWKSIKIELRKDDFPQQLTITKANLLYIPKERCSQRDC